MQGVGIDNARARAVRLSDRRHIANGLGTATLAAMNYAMSHDYDYLQNMDADFSHPPRYLPGPPTSWMNWNMR